jgi:transcriptional regulator with XRE-family HTH domain
MSTALQRIKRSRPWNSEGHWEPQLAKPDRQSKRRDGDRGRNRDRNVHEPMRDNVILHPASNRRPSGPRQDNSKAPVAKQGVKGALRAPNLRLLLETAPVREALALVAEVPLERLEAMAQGALCLDETAFHIERALKLPGKWLDGLNKEVPERTLELLKHPDQAGLHDDDLDEEPPTAPSVMATAPVQPTEVISAATQPELGQAPAPVQGASTQHGQAAQVAPSAPAKSAQEEVVLAAGEVEAMGAVEGSKAAAKPGAHASITAAAGQPRSSAAAARLKSGSKANYPMPSPELRQQNLSILLQGKGAKSALARLIGISQPYMSSIANGGKVLDQEFCRNVARTLAMPEDWFEVPRTAPDIPPVARQRLAPLRGAGSRTQAIPPSDAVEAEKALTGSGGGTTPEAASAPAESGESASAETGAAENHVLVTSASRQGTALKEKGALSQGEPQRDGPQRGESVGAAATAPVQVDLLSQIEREAQPAMQEATPARPAEVLAAAPIVVAPAPVMAAVAATAPQAVQRTREITSMSAQPLIIEGGLAPITEALIKILALKDRQGALSEDKAFELLGAVRLL